MGKHPLGNIDVCAKKTEYLLSARSHSFNIDVGIGYSTSKLLSMIASKIKY